MSTAVENKTVLSVRELQEDTAFFPRYVPLSSLPTLFRQWEEVTSQLSELLRTRNLRDTIHELPAVEFSRKTIHSAGEWQRALCVVSSIFQGYVWQGGEGGVPAKIPSILAVPLFNVCKEFGIPPIGTFAALSLYNWHLKDESKPFSLENLRANVTFTGTEDESWFYMIFVVIEKEFSPALSAIIAYIKAGDNAALLLSTLKVVEEAIKKIHATLNRIPERCSPSAFCSMRHYFAGTKGLQVIQKGLIYEGVTKDPLSFHGISAAQMPSIKAIDAFLGVQHKGTFLETMNEYIPEHHWKLLKFISLNQQSVRSAVLESRDNALIKQFNSTVQALVNLCSDHIILVTRYIINQRRGQSTAATLETVGTGGTHFMLLLKSARDRTKTFLIPVAGEQ